MRDYWDRERSCQERINRKMSQHFTENFRHGPRYEIKVGVVDRLESNESSFRVAGGGGGGGEVGGVDGRRQRMRLHRRDQQPWSSGRTPRCGWEVPGSRPGRSRTLNCTHWVTRDPTPIKRVLTYEGGVYVTNAPLTAGSVKRPDWPHLARQQTPSSWRATSPGGGGGDRAHGGYLTRRVRASLPNASTFNTSWNITCSPQPRRQRELLTNVGALSKIYGSFI